ncbi:MAG: hypothetical protein QE271_02210 [Bacteriovoracaceae bacterium]|nr:hypothetical protein [Bacteriovoracaceae bacterium]
MKNLKLLFFTGLFCVAMTSHAVKSYICESLDKSTQPNGRSISAVGITVSQVSDNLAKVEEVKKYDASVNNYVVVFSPKTSSMSPVFELKKSSLNIPNAPFNGQNIVFYENQKVLLKANFIFNSAAKPKSGTLSIAGDKTYNFSIERCLDTYRAPRGRF